MTRRSLIRGLALAAWLLTAAIAPGQFASAQDEEAERKVRKTGTTAASFLNIPVGARASAMGGAISASVNDGTAIYWNPAGLARIEDGTFTAEYASWLADIQHNYASVALPTSLGTFGVAVTAMTSPEMEVTTEAQQTGTGETFRASSLAFAVSYARSLTDRFSIGASVKRVDERIFNSSASGIALDIGTLFTTPFQGIRLGAAITNFGTKMQMSGDDLRLRPDPNPDQQGINKSATAVFDTDRFDMPLRMRIGAAGELVETAGSRVTLAVDFLSPSDNAQYVNVGAEVAMLGELLMLRGGYTEMFLTDSPRSFTLGGGLNYGFGSLHLAMDYAYEAHQYFNGVNRFTFSLHF